MNSRHPSALLRIYRDELYLLLMIILLIVSKNVCKHVVFKLKMDVGDSVWAISIVTGKRP